MPASSQPMRLLKYLSQTGVASRRKCDELILAGKVTVNGEVVTVPWHPIRPGVDTVQVAGEERAPEKLVYYKFYKPVGVLTAMSDERRGSLASFLPPDGPRVFPLGRLDRDAEGLLILTNNGELGNLLLHPKFHIDKEYEVILRPAPSRPKLKRLAQGIEIDGRPTKPSQWELIDRLPTGGVLVRVTLTEGRKNQIKRMAQAVGCEVLRLKRIRFGPVRLGPMKPGILKRLAAGEIGALERAAQQIATKTSA